LVRYLGNKRFYITYPLLEKKHLIFITLFGRLEAPAQQTPNLADLEKNFPSIHVKYPKTLKENS
jgi:hypothetical protein